MVGLETWVGTYPGRKFLGLSLLPYRVPAYPGYPGWPSHIWVPGYTGCSGMLVSMRPSIPSTGYLATVQIILSARCPAAHRICEFENAKQQYRIINTRVPRVSILIIIPRASEVLVRGDLLFEDGFAEQERLQKDKNGRNSVLIPGHPVWPGLRFAPPRAVWRHRDCQCHEQFYRVV